MRSIIGLQTPEQGDIQVLGENMIGREEDEAKNIIAQIRKDSGEAISSTRGFYGVLKVFEHNPSNPDLHYYTLVHGATSHG